MPDLIRLLHGNVNGIKKLIHEFRVYWQHKSQPSPGASVETGEDATPSVGAADHQPASPQITAGPQAAAADACNSPNPAAGEISKRQLELKIASIAQYKKGAVYPRRCWYVRDAVLDEYGLRDQLSVPTDWVYMTDVEAKRDQQQQQQQPPPQQDAGRSTPTASSKAVSRLGPSIKQFAVKTTSEDLFTSPSAASPKVHKPALSALAAAASPKPSPQLPQPISGSPSVVVNPSADGCTPSRKQQSPAVAVSASGGAKPARRVQLTTLTSFMAPAKFTPPPPAKPETSANIDAQSAGLRPATQTKPLPTTPASAGVKASLLRFSNLPGSSSRPMSSPQPAAESKSNDVIIIDDGLEAMKNTNSPVTSHAPVPSTSSADDDVIVLD